MKHEVIKMGKRGTVVIPADLRQKMQLKEGDLVIAECHEGGILLKPAVALAIEPYDARRKAEFLLSNAVDKADYKAACKEVKAMGIDPSTVPHHKPTSS